MTSEMEIPTLVFFRVQCFSSLILDMNTVGQPFGFHDLISQLLFSFSFSISLRQFLLDQYMHSEERSSHDVPVDRVHDVLPVREDSVDSEIRQKPSEDEVFLKMKGKNIVSVSVMLPFLREENSFYSRERFVCLL